MVLVMPAVGDPLEGRNLLAEAHCVHERGGKGDGHLTLGVAPPRGCPEARVRTIAFRLRRVAYPAQP